MDKKTIFKNLKKSLKLKGITYKKLAQMMDLSEATINRIFSLETFTIDRFLEICEVIEVPIEEIFSMGLKGIEDTILEATIEQEKFLAQNLEYFSFFGLLAIYGTPEKIAKIYNLNESTVTAILAKLDNLKLIEWLPGDKVRLPKRLSVSKDGPLSKVLHPSQLPTYFQDDFKGEGSFQTFRVVYVSEKVQGMMKSKLEEFSKELLDLRALDDLMKEEVHTVGIHLGLRDFEVPFIEKLRNFEIK